MKKLLTLTLSIIIMNSYANEQGTGMVGNANDGLEIIPPEVITTEGRDLQGGRTCFQDGQEFLTIDANSCQAIYVGDMKSHKILAKNLKHMKGALIILEIMSQKYAQVPGKSFLEFKKEQLSSIVMQEQLNAAVKVVLRVSIGYYTTHKLRALIDIADEVTAAITDTNYNSFIEGEGLNAKFKRLKQEVSTIKPTTHEVSYDEASYKPVRCVDSNWQETRFDIFQSSYKKYMNIDGIVDVDKFSSAKKAMDACLKHAEKVNQKSKRD